MNTTILPQDEEKEPNDVPKKFTNIDKEDFSFNWDGRPYSVKAGETATYPKYLVNYAAMHLARKMHKRHMIDSFVPEREDRKHIELQNANIRIVNPKHEIELQKKMVAANFEGEVPAPEPAPEPEDTVTEIPVGVKEAQSGTQTTETPKETPKPGVKCGECDFVAKSEFGLKSHMRKHK